jgi:peptidoglycan/xylan/chitin deacetylase (PgdA/CDA1 family)
MLRRLLACAVTIFACGGLAAAANGAAPTYVSLTFDDGVKGDIDFVLPALKQRGFAGTFYINSGTIADSAATRQADRMTWDEVKMLQTQGMEIGGHTVDHANLVNVWNDAQYTTDDQRRAAVQAKVCPDRTALVDHGLTPTSFAYPNGAWLLNNGADNTTIPGIVQGCGYSNARTTQGIALEPPDRHCDVCFAPLSDRGPTANRPYQPFGLRASQARGSYIAATGESGNDNLIPFEVLRDRTQYAIDAINSPGAADVPNTPSADGGWLILVLHDVCQQDGVAPCDGTQATADRGHSTTAAALNAYLDWLKSRPASQCVIVATVQRMMSPTLPTCPPPTNPGGSGGSAGGASGGGGGSATTTATTAPIVEEPAPIVEDPAPVTAAPSTSAPEPAAPTARLLTASAKLLGKGVVGFRAVVTAPAGVKRVEFLVDGKVVGTATAGPFRFSWSPKAGNGKSKARNVKISVRVTDSRSRVTQSAGVKVRVVTPTKGHR